MCENQEVAIIGAIWRMPATKIEMETRSDGDIGPGGINLVGLVIGSHAG